MRIEELEKNLNNVTRLFIQEIDLVFPVESTTPATVGDLHELAKQTFYMVDAVNEELIKYLKS